MILYCNEYKVYLTDSNPNGLTNKTFPEDCFYYGTQIKSSGMNSHSKVYNIFNKRKVDEYEPNAITPLDWVSEEI